MHHFSEAVAEALVRIAWWDWTQEELAAAPPDFRALPVKTFVEKYGGGR